jgi:hypothetical protein
MLQKHVIKRIVLDHIAKVIEDKTIQMTDHLINKVTLQNKIAKHKIFSDVEKMNFEGIMKALAGKNEKQHQKFMSGVEDEDKQGLTKYIEQKNDVTNLSYADKGIREHEDFLYDLSTLQEEITNEK